MDTRVDSSLRGDRAEADMGVEQLEQPMSMTKQAAPTTPKAPSSLSSRRQVVPVRTRSAPQPTALPDCSWRRGRPPRAVQIVSRRHGCLPRPPHLQRLALPLQKAERQALQRDL